MTAESWTEKSRVLAAAGLVVMGRDAQTKIEQLSNLGPLIEAANASETRLLTGQSIDELLSLVPTEETLTESNPEIQINSPTLQATLARPESGQAIGRTIAPITTDEPSPAPRPHGLDHYRMQDFPMQASDIDSEIEIHFDITGSSRTEGKMTDIQSFFGDRLKQIRNQLVSGGALPRRPISIAEAWRNRQRHTSKDYEITLVGLASESRFTRAGNLGFAFEDETQNIQCSLRPPSGAGPLHPALDGLMDDDVVGISGHFLLGERSPLFMVSNIHLPPMRQHSKATAGEDQAVSAAFLSDVHVGSKTFLAPQWEKMIQWFNSDPLARTVKYFVLSGDGVDGVGIYPGQERHLAITDLFAQYGELARLLEGLPDWVDVVILPGNHDAVRPAEPQPALDPEVQQDYSDAVFVGNPSEFSLHGVRILSYHGKSIDDFVAGLRSVTYSKPEMAMRAMLERRHLAPSWGGKTPLSPEPEDRMVIQQTPDIFVTGHVHGHYVGNHKGTTIVHSSTWQDQTDYQRMLGFQPKPCILTVINLHTHESASIPFA
ncbi:MAG: DNA polymerase II small subunit [Euryarchaeota archaeon]|nr:DNA polymerase II small subunit [Euryarchaeota archaeon]